MWLPAWTVALCWALVVAAQMDLIHTRALSHPYRWAALQLSGDWR